MSKDRGQEVSFVGAPKLDDAQLIVEQDVNKVKMQSSAVCRLRLQSGFGRLDASDPFYRSFITKNLYERHSEINSAGFFLCFNNSSFNIFI